MNLKEVIRCQGSLAYYTEVGTPKPTASRGQVSSQVSRHMGLRFFWHQCKESFVSLPRWVGGQGKFLLLCREKGTCHLHSARAGPVAWSLNLSEPGGDVICFVEDWCPIRCNSERKTVLALKLTPYQIKEPTTRNSIQWHPNNLINSIIMIFY